MLCVIYTICIIVVSGYNSLMYIVFPLFTHHSLCAVIAVSSPRPNWCSWATRTASFRCSTVIVWWLCWGKSDSWLRWVLWCPPRYSTLLQWLTGSTDRLSSWSRYCGQFATFPETLKMHRIARNIDLAFKQARPKYVSCVKLWWWCYSYVVVIA